MKNLFFIKLIHTLLLIYFTFTLKIKLRTNLKNPDEVLADSNGGNNGEFIRRNQPQEHIIIPLINSLEAEYSPNIKIKDYTNKLIEETNKEIQRYKASSVFFDKINSKP